MKQKIQFLSALIFTLVPSLINAQLKTSITNGNFSNPNTWNCSCVPANGDSIKILHTVTLDSDLHLTSKEIKILAPGKLLQDMSNRTLWIDGTAHLQNQGTLTVNKIRISPTATIYNNLTIISVDSIVNEGQFINNFSTHVNTISNKSNSNFQNFGNIGSFSIQNEGIIKHSGSIYVQQNFDNCNSNGNSKLDFSGSICIVGDFNNCSTDTVMGTGVISVSGSAINSGVIIQPSVWYVASGIINNTGTINPVVTINVGSCPTLDIVNHNNIYSIYVFPNPVDNIIFLELGNLLSISQFNLFNNIGQLLKTGHIENKQIDISNLSPGLYQLELFDGNSKIYKKIIKK